MPNTVYFLGAGASYCFGYPLTNDIMPGILQNLFAKDLFQLGRKKTTSEKKQESDLKQFIGLLYPGLKNIDPVASKHRIPTITEVLSMVEHFCFYGIPPHPQLNIEQLQQFRKLLNRAIGEYLLDFEMEDYDEYQNELLKRFIAPLRQEKKSGNLSVITTNYDLIIDWEFRDALRSGRVDYGIPYRSVSNANVGTHTVKANEIVVQPYNPLFRYYKLHGSLNWLKCEMCGHYYINPEGSILHNAFREVTDEGNTCICDNSLRLNSVLVSPSYVRDIRDANLLQIWKGALEAIRTADRLIFIGYSLPAEDFAIKSILMRGLNGRRRNNRLKVEVIQCGSNSKAAYENIFANGELTFFCKGLDGYFNLPQNISKKNKRPCRHTCDSMCL